MLNPIKTKAKHDYHLPKKCPPRNSQLSSGELKQSGQDYKVLIYGHYTHEEYLELLNKTKPLFFFKTKPGYCHVWSLVVWCASFAWIEDIGSVQTGHVAGRSFFSTILNHTEWNALYGYTRFPYDISLSSKPQLFSSLSIYSRTYLEICARRYLDLF